MWPLAGVKGVYDKNMYGVLGGQKEVAVMEVTVNLLPWTISDFKMAGKERPWSWLVM